MTRNRTMTFGPLQALDKRPGTAAGYHACGDH